MKSRPTRLFVEPDKISKHLHCAICHEVFDNPNRLGCGHTFCYVCIEYWASMSKTCPLCKKSLRHRRPEKDLIAASLVDDMITQCSHEKCEWKDVYSLLKRHQRTCQHRERKIYESRNFDEIVELNDDSEIKETVQNNKKGNKKIKEEEKVVMPTFPSSSPESQQLIRRQSSQRPPNLPLENRSLEQQGNYPAIPRLQPDDSFLSPVYTSESSCNNSCLDVRLDALVPNRMNENQNYQTQKTEKCSLQSMENRRKLTDNANDRFEKEKPQKNSEKGQQYKSNFKNVKRNEANIDEIQQRMKQSSVYEDQRDDYQLPSNYFIIQKNKRQEERQKLQKESNARISSNKWSKTFLKLKKVEQKSEKKHKKKATYSSNSNSQQDSSSVSNPFDEPIISKRDSKKNGEKVMIVLDSSGQSKLYESIQSGQMQLCYPREQKTTIPTPKQSKVQQKPKQSIEDSIINKTERINSQMKQLFAYQVEAQYQARVNRRNEMRGYSRN